MENNLIQGKIFPSLVKFALPVLLALFLQTLYGGVDLLIVGQFSNTANLSGVATGSMLTHALTMIVTGLAMGLTIVVGQRIGEGRPAEAGKAIGAGIVLFTIVAILLTVILYYGADSLTALLQAPREAFAETSTYIAYCGLGSIFIVAYNVLGAVFRGIGDSKTPLYTVLLSCVLNILLDLLLVAGYDLGAAGAAIATVISQGFSVLISLWLIKRRVRLPFTFTTKHISWQGSLMLQQLGLGVPIALQELLVGMSFLVLQGLVNTMGVNESAGIGVAEKLCGFIMLVPSAFMQSMAAFVAQNMGARQIERSRKALAYGIKASLVVGIFMGSFTFFKGDLLAGLFATQEPVIIAAHEYLKAYAIDTMLTAILFCMMGYFNGCGNTFFVMLQGIVGAVVVRIPVAFL